MIENRVRFPCSELSLEGILGIPEGEGPFASVIVCHPHPTMGGDMNNSVVIPICQALGRESIASLRFNFRGVGRSQGAFADGVGEQDDIRAAINYLSTLETIDKERIGLCGYSFGGAVALLAAPSDPRVKALALISPAVTPYFPLKQYLLPKLIICGGADQFVSMLSIQRLADADELPPPKECELIAGADHFWTGYEGKVASKVTNFFAKAFNPPTQETSSEKGL
jgi:alpha/beta superfamily hydrolase